MSSDQQKPPEDKVTKQALEKWLNNLTLPRALALVIAAAGVLVLIGFLQYWNSENRKYDIARPGQATENKALDVTVTEEDIATPVDPAAVDDKLQFLEDEKAVLDSLNKLEVDNLSDQNLRLTPSQRPSM